MNRQPHFTLSDPTAVVRLLSAPATQEVELSFGTFVHGERGRPSFRPGVSAYSFALLLRSFDNEQWLGNLHLSALRYMGNSTVQLGREQTRYITEYNLDGTVLTEYAQSKVRNLASSWSDQQYGLRISSSTEQTIRADRQDFAQGDTRNRERWMVQCGSFQLHLTQIVWFRTPQGARQQLPFYLYEIEIERDVNVAGSPNKLLDELQTVTGHVLFLLNDAWGPQLVPSTTGLMYQPVYLAKTNSSIQACVTALNSLVRARATPSRPEELAKGWWTKPLDLTLDTLYKGSNYFTTLKLDGVRKFLFLPPTGNLLYMIVPPVHISIVAAVAVAQRMQGFLIEGEEIITSAPGQPLTTAFYAFDILYYNGARSAIELEFDTRYELLSATVGRLAQTLQQPTGFLQQLAEGELQQLELGGLIVDQGQQLNLRIKEYFMEGDLYINLNLAANSLANTPLASDGIVLQATGNYEQQSWKWKPVSQMSLDLYLMPGARVKRSSALLFTPYVSNSRRELIQLQEVLNVQEIDLRVEAPAAYADRIVECTWDGEYLRPLRVRYDKVSPNSIEVAQYMWNVILYPIQTPTLRGQDLVLMRRWHNDIKRELLNKYVREAGRALLDIGSGRGGDLGKWYQLWQQGGLTVLAVEPSRDNALEFQSRLSQYPQEFQSSITLEQVPFQQLEVEQGYNLVTSFFSLSFFYSSQQLLEQWIDRVDQALIGGGYLVITTIVDKPVMQLLGKEPTSRQVGLYRELLDTCHFSLQQTSEWAPGQVFGRELLIDIQDPTSMVRQQTEWLVDLDWLEKRLQERGYQTVEQGGTATPQGVSIGPCGQVFNSLFRTLVMRKGVTTPSPSLPLPTQPPISIITVERDKFGPNALLFAYILSFCPELQQESDRIMLVFFRKVRERLVQAVQSKQSRYLRGQNRNDLIARIADPTLAIAYTDLWVLQTLFAFWPIVQSPTGQVLGLPVDKAARHYVIAREGPELDSYTIYTPSSDFILDRGQLQAALAIAKL